MKYVIAASALAIATPAAAQQQPAPHQGHGQRAPAQHQGHGQHALGQHQGHGQGQHQGHGQGQGGHQGHGESCPCCAPGENGQRPPCCERMHQQRGAQGAQPQAGHGNH